MNNRINKSINTQSSKQDHLKKNMLVSLDNISVWRNFGWIIENVSVQINEGQIVTLIGPNGAGKTSLAKVIMGLLKIDRGKIKRKKSLKIGYVPQKLSISKTMPITVKKMLSLSEKYSDKNIIEALEKFDILYLADKSIHNISGGEFRRVLLSRAMIRKPDLLVLDEPLQGIDVGGEAKLYNQIDEIRTNSGCGVLLISHDLHMVMAKTDTVICLDKHICCQGNPTEVVKKYTESFKNEYGRHLKSHLLYHHNHENKSNTN